MSNAALVEKLVESGAVRAVPVAADVRAEVDRFVKYASSRLGKSRASRRQFNFEATPPMWQARLLAAANEGNLDGLRQAAKSPGLFRVDVAKLDEVVDDHERRRFEAKKAARKAEDRRRVEVRKANRRAVRARKAALVKAADDAVTRVVANLNADVADLAERLEVVKANLERGLAMEAAREARKSGRTIPAVSWDTEKAAGPLADLLADQRAEKTGWEQ